MITEKNLTKKIMQEEAEKKGWTILSHRGYSHPANYYLMDCLVENHKGEFVIYTFNSISKGFNYGDYYDNPGKAYRVFSNKKQN